MISAFGVEHSDLFSKSSSRMDPSIVPLMPSTTVMAYNNSRYKKKNAAARNLAAKVSGSALGFGGGYLAYRYSPARKLATGTTKLNLKLLDGNKLKSGKLVPKKKTVNISEDKKMGYAASVITSLGAGAGGYIGGRESLKNIKVSPKYRYKEL
jgi:hypothetical protein